MQKTKAIDGTEWQAAQMTFMQNGYLNGFLNRTKLWAGTRGVFTGGVVATVSGLTVSVSGPLQFTANGELGIIAAPPNQVLANNATNYIIAKYAETEDTPAIFYGSGSPPNVHVNETPSIINRTSGPAILGNGEVDLATVTTSGGAVTLITDTRIILPTVTEGNIALGALKTIDGVDPSVHVATVATNVILGHVLLGAAGGAAKFEDVPAAAKYWIVDSYIFGRSGGTVLDEADFTSPPGGETVKMHREVTTGGAIWKEGYGPEWNIRGTLNFTSSAAFNHTGRVLTVDDSIRVRLNGTQVYIRSTSATDLDASFTLPIVLGSNQLKFYFCNNGGAEWRLNLLLDELLLDNRITFNPL